MNKQILTLALALTFLGLAMQSTAQSNKERKSRYYQNNSPDPEFDVKGFSLDREKNEVEKTPVESEYNVKIDRNERDGKYRNEKRVIEKQQSEPVADRQEEMRRSAAPRPKGYYSSTGAFIPYKESRESYDKYYTEGGQPADRPAPVETPVARNQEPRKPVKEKEIKMTSKENEYVTTVVKRKYTNLDVLCDDLDLAKIQRPVFKGICSETANDVDAIIVNKNMTSLEKNYHLKQCYILRDKRLRETLDTDQYKKFLRIKDADEYLILTKDPELKDGVNK